MKYAVEMASGGMIYEYIPSFMTIGSGFQKFWGKGYRIR
jgi:hypothetical protein